MSEPSRRRWLTDGRPKLGLVLLMLALLSIGMLLYEGAGKSASTGLAPFRHFDKVLHFGAHCWVAGLLFWGGALLARPNPPRKRALLISMLVLVLDAAAGIGVELAQSRLGASHGRVFDWKDVSANLAGAIFALIASSILFLKLTRDRR